MALLLPARFGAWLSDIQWDGNERYPLSTGWDEIDLKFSPSTSSAKASGRSGFKGPAGSSVPPKWQRLLASKNYCWARAGGARGLCPIAG